MRWRRPRQLLVQRRRYPDNEGVRSRRSTTCSRSPPRVVAIGETRLDYYRLNGRSVAEMAWQRERFRGAHPRRAGQHLPLVVHTRSVRRHAGHPAGGPGRRAGGVFHCFTETMEVARAALDLGF